MSTHRSLRLGLLALSTAALAAACGEPFGFVGNGGSSSTSSGTGGASTSSGTAGGSGGTGGTASTSSGTTMTGTGGATSSSSSSGGCDDTDPDGDGVTGCDGDCDNNDPDVYPGAAEICGDNKDNDCNKTIDDNCGGLGTYVANNGDDNNPGTQGAPVLTIAKGIEHAQTINNGGGDGSRVFVAKGHYPEDVFVVEGISLYGGYDSTDWSRDPTANDTAILAQGPDGVYCDDTITRQTVIDGFRLQGKDNSSTGSSTPWGAAITADGGTPTISGNVINGPAEGSGLRSIGLVILGPSNDAAGPLVTGNRISGGTGQCDASTGVLLASATWPPPGPGAGAEITGNAIRSGSCKSSFALISWANADGTIVSDNDITAGTANAGSAFGAILAGSPLDALIIFDKNRVNVDQTIVGTCPTASLGWCGGIDSQNAKARITNNIVFGVKATRSTAIWVRNPEAAPASLALNSNYLDGAGSPTIAGAQSAAIVVTLNNGTNGVVGRIRNNILAGGVASVQFGVFEDSVLTKQAHPEKLENNDFFLAITGGNAYYRTWDGVTANKLTTIDAVNMLQNSQANIEGDCGVDSSFHLVSSTSICVDTGTGNEMPADDIDGQARTAGENDIGPDEK